MTLTEEHPSTRHDTDGGKMPTLPRDMPTKPRKEPTAALPGKGSKQGHKGTTDVRKAPWKANVIKVKMDMHPLSDRQIKWGLTEVRKAWAYQCRQSKDDRSFDEFRHDVVSEATREHEAGPAHGLSAKGGAKKAHFNALMSYFFLLQNEGGKALEWAEKDGDEALRLGNLRFLIRERLAWVPTLADRESPEQVAEDQRAYGDAIAMKQYGRPWMSLNADQCDWFYRTLKAGVTRAKMEEKAAAWVAKQGEEAV